jgi:hypothetical protein
MSEETSLLEKMKTMSKEELEGYYDTTGSASRLLNILGVGLILLALIFSDMIFIAGLAIVAVYIVGQLAVGLDETKDYISDLLEKKYKINS